jgi:hypothetical protein
MGFILIMFSIYVALPHPTSHAKPPPIRLTVTSYMLIVHPLILRPTARLSAKEIPKLHNAWLVSSLTTPKSKTGTSTPYKPPSISQCNTSGMHLVGFGRIIVVVGIFDGLVVL